MFDYLISLFTDKQALVFMLLRLPCILFAISCHEAAHGYAAYKLGDPTARNLGRLTLNPLKHLDLFGTLCMIFVGVGWAKPVQVNSRYFKKPRRDMALTALAGPAANLLLSFAAVIVLALLSLIPYVNDTVNTIVYGLFLLFYVFHNLNLTLAIFNLIPIPPLDGSRLLFVFLPDKYYFGLMRYERIIGIIFLIGLWTGIITAPVFSIAEWISGGMVKLVNLLPFINLPKLFF